MRLKVLSARSVALLISAPFAVKVTAFHSYFPSTSDHLNSLKGGGYNHLTTTKRAETSSPENYSLRHHQSDIDPPSGTMEAIRSRLAEHNLELPPPGGPKANYELLHRDGDLLYLSGHLPIKSDGTLIVGACAPSRVIEGDETQKWLTTDQGYEAAQHCALNLLSTLQSYLSTHVKTEKSTSQVSQPADLSHIKVVKLFGIVRSHNDFVEQHLVMNGASDVLKQVLGKDMGGCHARSAIGTNTLPLGICVEVEMIAKIRG